MKNFNDYSDIQKWVNENDVINRTIQGFKTLLSNVEIDDPAEYRIVHIILFRVY